MHIYTKTGDRGTTGLASGTRVSKTDFRLEAYGTADELNSFVGLLRARSSYQDEQLYWIQNRLFNLGAALSDAPGEWISGEDTRQLEQWIDAMQETLPPMREFILPGGDEATSLCHVCRTVTRRLERRIVALENDHNDAVYAPALTFVNRLSDYFFVLSRFMAKEGNICQFVWNK